MKYNKTNTDINNSNNRNVVGNIDNISNTTNNNKDFNYEDFKRDSIKKLYEGKGLTGKDGVFTGMIKDFLETALKEELNSHLNNERNSLKDDFNNRRNGYTSKTIKTGVSDFELDTPRDRDNTFEPNIVKKNQTILTEELDNKILSLYSLGMSYRDISKHIEEMYGIEISKSLISNITDKIIPQIEDWQNRPLESIFPIVFLDAIHFKCREEGQVITKAFYTVLGINQQGKKDVLGLYISESEGANFWLSVLTDLKNRGIEDILICCIDGLKGFPEAINTIFPKTEIQVCIVHQIRNSLKYVASKDQKEFMINLKEVYKANNKDYAETKLLDLEEKWGKKYPIVIKSWNSNWNNLSSYFKFPEEIRRIIYTTNAVEGLHRQIRKYTKSKGSFTTQEALKKLIYLAIQNITEKWSQPIQNWSLIISQLDLYFEKRLKLDLK